MYSHSLTKAKKENSAGLIVLFRSLQGGFALEFLEQTANFILGYRKYHSQLTLTNPIHRTDSTVPTLIPAPKPKGGSVHCGQTGAAPQPDTEPSLGQLRSRTSLTTQASDPHGQRPESMKTLLHSNLKPQSREANGLNQLSTQLQTPPTLLLPWEVGSFKQRWLERGWRGPAPLPAHPGLGSSTNGQGGGGGNALPSFLRLFQVSQ